MAEWHARMTCQNDMKGSVLCACESDCGDRLWNWEGNWGKTGFQAGRADNRARVTWMLKGAGPARGAWAPRRGGRVGRNFKSPLCLTVLQGDLCEVWFLKPVGGGGRSPQLWSPDLVVLEYGLGIGTLRGSFSRRFWCADKMKNANLKLWSQ